MQELLSGPTRGTTAAASKVDLPSRSDSSSSKIILRQRTDISVDGQQQTQWLIATNLRLMVALEKQPKAEASLNAAETLEEVEPFVSILREIELAEVESLRTTAGTGTPGFCKRKSTITGLTSSAFPILWQTYFTTQDED